MLLHRFKPAITKHEEPATDFFGNGAPIVRRPRIDFIFEIVEESCQGSLLLFAR